MDLVLVWNFSKGIQEKMSSTRHCELYLIWSSLYFRHYAYFCVLSFARLKSSTQLGKHRASILGRLLSPAPCWVQNQQLFWLKRWFFFKALLWFTSRWLRSSQVLASEWVLDPGCTIYGFWNLYDSRRKELLEVTACVVYKLGPKCDKCFQ